MPVYEYRCNACDHQFELRQKFSDPPADSCPKCGGTARKMVSTVAFSLKGGGWYAEGYGAKAETPKEIDTAAGAGAAPETASTDSAPKESVPKETTESPTAPAPAASQAEPKSTVTEKTATVEKAKSE